jgi:hypothetical protein
LAAAAAAASFTWRLLVHERVGAVRHMLSKQQQPGRAVYMLM